MASTSTQPASCAATTLDVMTASASVPNQDQVATPREPSLAEPALLSATVEHLSTSTAPLDGPSSPPRLDLGHLGGVSATALATDATFPREAAVNTEDVGDSDDEYGGLPIALTTNITQSRSHGGTGQSSSSATAPFDITDFLSRSHAGGQASPATQQPTHAPEAAPRASTSICNDARHTGPSQVSAHPITDMFTRFAKFARFLSSRAPSLAANLATLSAEQLTATALDTNSWTLPNDRGELPPPAICILSAADF
ncbi:hypothetical protein PI125_g12239 [Phytophthora idaei]|nr:hypothetical protein PI125_g12239 [Phytophthora idaei]